MAQRQIAVAYNTERARWEAVLKRDRAAGNSFVYTVSSTGIYCRPTCPARVARRANVGFYDHASQAAAVGFRPCKRCKPEIAEGQPEDAAITAIKNFVATDCTARPQQTLRQMADQAGLSKWHFHRTFVKVMGITPGEWTKQQIQARSSSTSSTIPSEAWPIFDVDSFSPVDSSVPASTPISVESTEGFDQLFNVADISEPDWLNMIDFDALGESVEWNSLPE